MPYLPVDLDGKRKAEGIEKALSLPRFSVVGGLLELWEGVWRDKSDRVDALALTAAFGADPRIPPALVARGFLEPLEEGGHRVRGAAKWLFGMEGPARAGKARAASARRDAAGRLLPIQRRSSAHPAPIQRPLDSTDLDSATDDTPASAAGAPLEPLDQRSASPFTQHPAPSTHRKAEEESKNLAGIANATHRVSQADFLEPGPEKSHAPCPTKTSRQRRRGEKKEDTPSDPLRRELSDALVAEYAAACHSPYVFSSRDGKALGGILEAARKCAAHDPVAEARRRFRYGLTRLYGPISYVHELESTWNKQAPDRAANGATPPRPVSREDLPCETL